MIKKFKFIYFFVFALFFFSSLNGAVFELLSPDKIEDSEVNLKFEVLSGSTLSLYVNSDFVKTEDIFDSDVIIEFEDEIYDFSISKGSYFTLENINPEKIFEIVIPQINANLNLIYGQEPIRLTIEEQGRFNYENLKSTKTATITVSSSKVEHTFSNLENYFKNGDNRVEFKVEYKDDLGEEKEEDFLYNIEYNKYPNKITLYDFLNETNTKDITIKGYLEDSDSDLYYGVNINSIGNLGALDKVEFNGSEFRFDIKTTYLREGQNTIRLLTTKKGKTNVITQDKTYEIRIDTKIPSIEISDFYFVNNPENEYRYIREDDTFFLNEDSFILNITTDDGRYLEYILNDKSSANNDDFKYDFLNVMPTGVYVEEIEINTRVDTSVFDDLIDLYTDLRETESLTSDILEVYEDLLKDYLASYYTTEHYEDLRSYLIDFDDDMFDNFLDDVENRHEDTRGLNNDDLSLYLVDLYSFFEDEKLQNLKSKYILIENTSYLLELDKNLEKEVRNDLKINIWDSVGNFNSKTFPFYYDTEDPKVDEDSLKPSYVFNDAAIRQFEKIEGQTTKPYTDVVAFTLEESKKDDSGKVIQCSDYEGIFFEGTEFETLSEKLNQNSEEDEDENIQSSTNLLELIDKKIETQSDSNGNFNGIISFKAASSNEEDDRITSYKTTNTMCFITNDKFGNINSQNVKVDVEFGNSMWAVFETTTIPNTLYAAEIAQIDEDRYSTEYISANAIVSLNYLGPDEISRIRNIQLSPIEYTGYTIDTGDSDNLLFDSEENIDLTGENAQGVSYSDVSFSYDKTRNELVVVFPVRITPLDDVLAKDYPTEMAFSYKMNVDYEIENKEDYQIDTQNPIYVSVSFNIERPIEVIDFLSPAKH